MSIRANVDARRLDQRIRIERATHVSDGSGGHTTTWNLLVACAAAVDGAKAGERLAPDVVLSVSGYVFWVRADIFTRFGLVLTDRIVWGGQPFNIDDMPNQQLRGRLIGIVARTGLNQG